MWILAAKLPNSDLNFAVDFFFFCGFFPPPFSKDYARSGLRAFFGGNTLFPLKVGLRWVFVNRLEWVQKWVKSGFLGAKVGKNGSKPTLALRKIRAPIKIKSALPPPPPQNPPPKKGNFTDMVFPAERTHFFQGSIKLAHPFPTPELRTRILRTRGFFWCTHFKPILRFSRKPTFYPI